MSRLICFQVLMYLGRFPSVNLFKPTWGGVELGHRCIQHCPIWQRHCLGRDLAGTIVGHRAKSVSDGAKSVSHCARSVSNGAKSVLHGAKHTLSLAPH